MRMTIEIDPEVSTDYEIRITDRGMTVSGPPEKTATYEPHDTPTADGHTPATIRELRQRLRDQRGRQQADVLDEMAVRGGYIDRQSTYDTIGREPDKALTGFTRPVHRVMKDMVQADRLHPDAASPLVPEYDDDNPSFQKAQGFRMPSDLAELWCAVLDEE